MPSESSHLDITFITVCVDPELTALTREVANDCGWTLTEAAFTGYISARRRPHFADNLKAGDGCVALIDFDQDAEEAAAAASYLQHVFSGRIAVVALSKANDVQVMLRAMQAGCTEFLVGAPTKTAILEALARVEQSFADRRTAPHAVGSLIALFGAKGGVGTTTLAVHVAAFLVRSHGKKVLLIDNHAQFGHACIYLGIDGSGVHFQELVRNVTRLDSELIHGFVATHEIGLDILSSPDIGHGVRPMHPDDVGAALQFLCTEYDFVIVDCDDVLDEINRVVMATAAQVYVVATPEISALRDLSRYVDELVRLHDMTNKVKVVINRYSSQFAVSLEEIERAIRLPISFSVPNSYIELVRSANLGIPLEPGLKVGFCIELTRWASSLVGEATRARTAAPEYGSGAFWHTALNRLSAVIKPARRKPVAPKQPALAGKESRA